MDLCELGWDFAFTGGFDMAFRARWVFGYVTPVKQFLASNYIVWAKLCRNPLMILATGLICSTSFAKLQF